MGNVLVKLDKVWRVYEQGRLVALRDISLQLHAGEWLTILGPSGCGKTTLLNLTCGLDLPSKGSVWFEGTQPSSRFQWTALRARRVGFVFQSFNLIPTLTSLENVQVPMLGVIKGLQARRHRAQELLELVGLASRQNHLPGQLSGGERQRVAIARSLANSPPLILADEPTGNLDSESAAKTMDLLQQLHSQHKVAVMLITHNPNLAAIGNRLLRMLDGAEVQDSSAGKPLPCAL